jgi:hypothetical protein
LRHINAHGDASCKDGDEHPEIVEDAVLFESGRLAKLVRAKSINASW